MFKTTLTLTLSIFLFYCSGTLAMVKPNESDKKHPSTSKKDSLSSNNTINKNFLIHVKKRSGPIKLDGIIDEQDWLKAEKATNFYMVLPYDTGHCIAKSEVMMTYDDKAFYIASVFHDSVPGKRPVESLRRDWNFVNNDNFCAFIDPFNDQTTGYAFGVNAAGAQRDGSISEGRTNNLVWDGKWESKVRNYGDRWTSEIRIPFKTVRYKTGVNHWDIQFSRNDMKMNEKSAWAPVPRQFPTAALAYTGQLVWDTPPPKSGLNLSLIPYLFGRASQNNEAGEDVKYKKNFGFDAKLGLSSSLNLDLTYNPDFSQAEVDDQVTNLSRFELYFPEKRQFFLENSDLFANYGSTDIRPFFSRRIGLDAPVTAGARLSGKIGQDWRIGVMDMQTGKEGAFLNRNFFVTTIQKKLFARSNIGMILVNKQQMDIPANWVGNSYNRVAGLEYNLASRDNFWTGKLFGLKSFTPSVTSSQEYSQGFELLYSRTSCLLGFREYYVGKDFNAETGYIPRTDYLRLDPSATFKFYPKKGSVEFHGFLTECDNFYRIEKNELTDRQILNNYFIRYKNMSQIDFKTNIWYVLLRDKFDPTNKKVNFLQSGSAYNTFDASLSYTSDSRKPFKYILQTGYGGFYNGQKLFFGGNLNYRLQPYGYISLIFNYNDLFLPQPWNRTGFWLIGPKVDVTFTEKLFFSTYVQYSQQADNMNINARFQWRYKPVSDFFVVYTNNYFPVHMSQKNWALVLKVTYWIN